MKAILSLIISSALVVSGYSQTRNVLVGTNNTVVQPTNFWSADASNARTGLGLGSAATNNSSAFQPSSAVLSNLASSNAANLINLQATNIVGAIPASNISSVTISNLIGTVGIASGGTGATNAGGARTNLGLGATWLTNTNVTNFRTEIGLGTNDDPVFNGATIDGDLFAQSLETASGTNSTIVASDGIEFTGVAAPTTRTNLGLGAIWLTNTNVTNFRTAIGLGATNDVAFNAAEFFTVYASGISVNDDGIGIKLADDSVNIQTNGISFSTNAAAGTRTNLGLGWPALTNSNAGTGLVSVNTNGAVVSPTNFWQVAPIQTVVQSALSTGATNNITNNATNARNLYLYSLATNTINTTNNIILPINTSTFGGDNATIIHQGPTSSVTVVRQAGDTNDLISINRFDESVKFIYENNAWAPYHNIGFQEPIYFSGTNTSNNVAITRTNLGLGQASSVRFGEGTEANVGVGVGSTNVGLTSGGATIQGRLGLIEGGNIVAVLDGDASPFFGLYRPITFQGTNATSNAATTRTNLFGHGGLSTNIDIKLNNNDGMRLYFTNGILTNAVTPIP